MKVLNFAKRVLAAAGAGVVMALLGAAVLGPGYVVVAYPLVGAAFMAVVIAVNDRD